MLSCWDISPSDRPTFSALKHTFGTLLSNNTETTYIDLMADPNEAYYRMDDDLFAEMSLETVTEEPDNPYDMLDEHKDYDHLKEPSQYLNIRVQFIKLFINNKKLIT